MDWLMKQEVVSTEGCGIQLDNDNQLTDLDFAYPYILTYKSPTYYKSTP